MVIDDRLVLILVFNHDQIFHNFVLRIPQRIFTLNPLHHPDPLRLPDYIQLN